MSSSNISNLKVHFLTDKQFNDKQSPSANELWFTKLPHWLKYCSPICLGLTTLPTASGNEINFYAGAIFVVHLGKYSDGTNKNQLLYIDEDKYTTVSADGAYCFDASGNIVKGTITYDTSTNKVSVNGTEGNYTQAVQSYTYSGGTVTLGDFVEVYKLGGDGSASYTYDDGSWVIELGNGIVMQGGTGYYDYTDVNVTFLVEMKDTNYSSPVWLEGYSYYPPYVSSKSTTGISISLADSWSSCNVGWMVIGEKA